MLSSVHIILTCFADDVHLFFSDAILCVTYYEKYMVLHALTDLTIHYHINWFLFLIV